MQDRIAIIDSKLNLNYNAVEHILMYDDSKLDYNGLEETHSDRLVDIVNEYQMRQRIIVLETYDESSSKFSDFVKAIQYCKQEGYRLCNISLVILGNVKEYDYIVKESETFFVVAAGNYSMNLNEETSVYPACLDYDNVLTVAAVDHNNELLPCSNYGNRFVDLAYYGTGNPIDGTSFACMRVSCIVQQILDSYPYLSNKEIKTLLLKSCDDSLVGLVKSNGVLDLDLLKEHLEAINNSN